MNRPTKTDQLKALPRLTLAEAVERLCAGKPFLWLTVNDGSETYEIAVDPARPQHDEGGAA